MEKNTLSDIYKRVKEDIASRTGIKTNVLIDDDSVGSAPEIKMEFVQVFGVNQSQNDKINSMSARFNLILSQQLNNLDNIAEVSLAMTRFQRLIKQCESSGKGHIEVAKDGYKIYYEVENLPETRTEQNNFAEMYRLAITINVD
jgi:hypothetical protein